MQLMNTIIHIVEPVDDFGVENYDTDLRVLDF